MRSKVEICNIALAHIRAATINSLDEASEAARKCKLVYDNCLESTLRVFPWNFAMKINLLALTEETMPGWLYIYQYPADCLHVRRIFDIATVDSYKPNKYRIVSALNTEERRICCNLAQAYIEYTSKKIDSEVYDTEFADALSWRLAAELAQPLTADKSLAQYCEQKYYSVITTAMTNNANEGYEEFKEPYDYINARL